MRLSRFILLLVCLGLAGCGQGGQQGKMVASPVYALQSLVNQTNLPDGIITVSGEMVEKCNVSGCWFYLGTNNSRIKVDVKNSGFSAVDVPLHSQVKVSANIRRDGDALVLEATGMEW